MSQKFQSDSMEGVDEAAVNAGSDYDMSTSLSRELEEGEVIEGTELICVGQEDLERLAAEEEAAEIEFSPADAYLFKLKRRGQDLLKYHIVSCQTELEELRKQNASEDAMIDPKEKLHLVKYVKIDGKIVKLWECGICSKDFRHQYTLMRHLPTHTDERKYICDICEKAFRQMSTLSQHRAIHSNARPYVCEVCQKTFNRVSTLISHRRTHFDDKPHKCHVCGKGFHQKGNLKNHVFSHTNERPYRCELCGRGFNQMSNLVVHKFKSHGQTGHVQRSPRSSPEAKSTKRTKPSVKSKSAHNRKNSSAESLSFDGFTINVDGEEVHEKFVPKTKGSKGRAEMKNDDRSTSGLLIDSIQTRSMQEARSNNRNAFALLKSIDGTPSLVKIFDLPNDKQLLVPATAEDLTDAVKKPISADASKCNQVKVAVVATVTQQMDQDGQLVVCIEPTEDDEEKTVDAAGLQTEGTAQQSMVSEATSELNDTIAGEQIQFVRPLPDGGFEIISEEEAANFLEIVDGEGQTAAGTENETANLFLNSDDRDTAQIIISQDEDGQLLVEGTPLQFLLGSSMVSQNQQIQLVVNESCHPETNA